MKKMNTSHLVSLLLNEPLNYERMLEIPTDELEFLKDECDSVMKEIKNNIIKEYEIIKPSLLKMRDWKHQLRQLKEKREIYKTFISIDKNTSLLSGSSVSSVDVKPVSFSELFRDIENDKLIEDGSPIATPKPPPTPKFFTPSTRVSSGDNTRVDKKAPQTSKIMKPVQIEPKKVEKKPPFTSILKKK